jgi:hypothetical protein
LGGGSVSVNSSDYRVNRSGNCFSPAVISTVAYVAYLFLCEPAESSNRFIESGLPFATKISSDFSGLLAESVDYRTEFLSETYRVRCLGFGSKAPQKTEKLSPPIISRDLLRVPLISLVATDSKEVTEKRSDKASAQESHNRRENAVSCGLVWHVILGIAGVFTGTLGIQYLEQSNHFVEAPDMIANPCLADPQH